jgi:hypothetical protein
MVDSATVVTTLSDQLGRVHEDLPVSDFLEVELSAMQ